MTQQVSKVMWIRESGIGVSAHENKSDLPIVAFSHCSALAKAAPVPDNPAKPKALHEAIGGRDRLRGSSSEHRGTTMILSRSNTLTCFIKQGKHRSESTHAVQKNEIKTGGRCRGQDDSAPHVIVDIPICSNPFTTLLPADVQSFLFFSP
jgi:hypothetical protein